MSKNISTMNQTTIGKFSIPDIALNEGDWICLHFPNSTNVIKELNYFKKVILGQISDPNFNLIHPFYDVSCMFYDNNIINKFLRRDKIKNIIKKYPKINIDLLNEILFDRNLNHESSLFALPCNQRLYISFLIATAYTNNILLNLSGLDPSGVINTIVKTKKEVIDKGGVCLEIIFPKILGHLDCNYENFNESMLEYFQNKEIINKYLSITKHIKVNYKE